MVPFYTVGSETMFGDYDIAIQQYKDIKENGGFPTIRCSNRVFRPGTVDDCVPDMVKRMAITGDMISDHTGNLYDVDLAESVKVFQRRHHIEVDGIVGPQTLREMNRSVDERISMLEKAKSDHAKIPKHGGKKVVVNIPSFRVWTFDNEMEIFSMKAVVGRLDRRTARFHDEITYVDFRPYWNVPTSIFRRDKMKKILKYGPRYLEQNHYQLLDKHGNIISPYSVNWKLYEGNTPPYRLRQIPGEWNALGLVKFMFPNRYSIYMHDTPNKELFEEHNRTFSSGCIRLSDPAKMGEFILDMPAAEVERRMHDETKNNDIVRLALSQRIPIYIEYVLAWIDKDGTVNFSPDIYNIK